MQQVLDFARFRADLISAARRDRVLYAIALSVLATAYALQPLTGNRPDWAVVLKLGGRLALIGGALAAALLAWRLGRIASARSRTPARDLARWAAAFFRGDGLAATALHTVALFFVFGVGFAVLKGAIALLAPFSWDAALADLDRTLHFGRYPHEWLQPLLARPRIVYAVNFAYNLWFLVLVAAFVGCACATGRRALRHQYLMSFMLVWFVGGFLIATGFSSAGPSRWRELAPRGEVFAIYLLRECHGRGIGRALWGAAIADLRARNLLPGIVWVLAENPAREFYERVGAVELVRRPCRIEEATHLEEVGLTF